MEYTGQKVEAVVDPETGAVKPQIEAVLDAATGDVSVVIDHVEMGRIERAVQAREVMARSTPSAGTAPAASVSMLPVGANKPGSAMGFVAEQATDGRVHAIVVLSFVDGHADSRVFGDVLTRDLVFALDRLWHHLMKSEQ